MADLIYKFAFVTPAVVARDMPRISLDGNEAIVLKTLQDTQFDAVTHRASVKLQIAFPDPSLLQYDCGKLQELSRLLREKKRGGPPGANLHPNDKNPRHSRNFSQFSWLPLPSIGWSDEN